MIEGCSAEVLRATAAPHVVAMGGVTSLKCSLRQTAGVAGGARAFQAVDQNQFSGGCCGRSLGMHQDLYAGFGFVQPGFDGEAVFIQLPLPVVAGDGGEGRIPEEGDERGQETILKEKGEHKEHEPSYHGLMKTAP